MEWKQWIFYEDKDVALIILDVMMPKWMVGRCAVRFETSKGAKSLC